MGKTSVRTVWTSHQSKSVNHRPKHTERAQEMSHYHWGEFQTHVFHVVPFMDPIVSVMNLHGRETCSRKADLSVKPDNGFVNGQCMSVAIDDLRPKEVRHEKLKPFHFAYMGCEKSPFCRAVEQGNHAVVQERLQNKLPGCISCVSFLLLLSIFQRTSVAQKASLYQVLPSSLYKVLPSDCCLTKQNSM